MKFTQAMSVAVAAGSICSGVMAQSTAVQWTTASGGNGHWYGSVGTQACWESARVACELEGGHLATPTSESESSFIRALVPSSGNGAWLGGIQAPGSCEPACGWSFITGERWVALWAPGQPENGNGTATQRTLTATQFGIHDGWDCDAPMIGIIEYSADCNSDGIVDYGQILSGQLTDTNSNGIPDICEIDPCPGDINLNSTFDAFDLAMVLTSWGTSGGDYPRAYVNHDGIVSGPDLGALLSGWGACP